MIVIVIIVETFKILISSLAFYFKLLVYRNCQPKININYIWQGVVLDRIKGLN